MWGPRGGHVGVMWGSCGGHVGAMWGPCGGHVGLQARHPSLESSLHQGPERSVPCIACLLIWGPREGPWDQRVLQRTQAQDGGPGGEPEWWQQPGDGRTRSAPDAALSGHGCGTQGRGCSHCERRRPESNHRLIRERCFAMVSPIPLWAALAKCTALRDRATCIPLCFTITRCATGETQSARGAERH